MHQLPFKYADKPEPKPLRLKPWLQLALALVVLIYCAKLWLR